MKGWMEVTLGELCTLRAGSVFKTHYQGQSEGEIPFIKVSDMNLPENQICIRKANHWVSEDVRAEMKAKTFPKGTTVFAKIGEGLKQNRVRLLVRDTLIDNNMMGAMPKPDVVEPAFFFYRLSDFDIASTATGTALPYLTVSTLERSRFTIPPLSIQRQITAILAAYDDLIENNTRRIQILERMAQALYREWFVHFRFPGHAKVKLVDSPLGGIPQGWQVVPVPEAVFVNPKTAVPKEGEKPFLPMTSLSNGFMLITDIESRQGNSGSKFKNGDTLFARITPCLENGKTGFVQFMASEDDVAFGSTEFIVLRSRTVTPEYVYLLARSADFRGNAIKSMTGATGRQRVQETSFNKFLIAQPGERELAAFTEVVRPMFKLIHCLADKNANLRRTRDLLLPKLISGTLDVAKLNIETA